MKVTYNPNKVFMARPKGGVEQRSARNGIGGKSEQSKAFFNFSNFFLDKRSKKPQTFKPKTEILKADYKVFKPKNDSVFKGGVLPKVRSVPARKAFSWGVKNLDYLHKGGLQLDGVWKSINLLLMRFQVLEKFNRIMALLSVVSIGLFFLYLCFFDTGFLIKNYTVTFADGSYISGNDMETVLSRIKSDKFAGFIPNNQFWFLNGPNLTVAAQRAYPEIRTVDVERRFWPNGAELKITTQPILVTLGINQGEYWRISQSGKVLSLDEAGLRENLVVVERRVEYNRKGVTLKDYSFENNEDQLNRFWFVIWIWSQLDNLGVSHTKTVLPSLFDTDVQILTDSGTKMIFDSKEMTRDMQSKRLASVYTGVVKDKDQQGKLAYIDFRIPRRVFVCERGQACDK